MYFGRKGRAGIWHAHPAKFVRAELPRIEDGVNARGIMVNDNRPLWFAPAQNEGSAAVRKDVPSDAKPWPTGLASWPLAAAAMRLVGPQRRR